MFGINGRASRNACGGLEGARLHKKELHCARNDSDHSPLEWVGAAGQLIGARQCQAQDPRLGFGNHTCRRARPHFHPLSALVGGHPVDHGLTAIARPAAIGTTLSKLIHVAISPTMEPVCGELRTPQPQERAGVDEQEYEGKPLSSSRRKQCDCSR